MQEFSVLIGGKAGFGIDTSSLILARILNQLGWYIYIYRDYPSLIRGGHTFSIIRAADKKISTHRNQIDLLLALDQNTLDFHKARLSNGAALIYDSDSVKSSSGLGIAFTKIIKQENAPEIMRNSCMVGAFCKACGISEEALVNILKQNIDKEIDLNLKIALRGFQQANLISRIKTFDAAPLPILSGNEAIGLGLASAGLNSYIAYPMTPSSGILHYLANLSAEFGLKVVHPENEIAVMLMALGAASAGEKVAVGTSGGGFCLMTEGLSFSGMAELPLVVVLGQRTGPSTGLPTYTGQTELNFAIWAGHGEFSRLVVAPADAEQAFYWSAVALNLAIKFQIPAIILSDKTVAEGAYSFDLDSVNLPPEEQFPAWDKKDAYKRYLDSANGVSPLAFFGDKDAIVKINSYEHDEYGITTEDPQVTKKMQAKRLRKEKYLSEELRKYKVVNTAGSLDSSVAVVCWGSNAGVCAEAARNLGIRFIQPVVLWPFPLEQIKRATEGVKKIICVENNSRGQLAGLLSGAGIRISEQILRSDGRPFVLDELQRELNVRINGE